MPLAAGGMARIYIGRTTGIGSFERHVVLKLILPEKQNDITAVHMFLDEARLAAALNHQNVAQVFEVGEDGGIHYLAMEYVHGQDLRALLAKAGGQGSRVPLELALTVVAGAAAGLNHAHERRGPDGVPLGIVHRDVSPSNIMIGYDGSVKLLDFGIAKATARSVETQSGIIKGKFAYMAPEQCRGRDVDRRSDVFSLGIILYEISTQHRCFRADSDFDTMHRIVTGDVVRPTRLVQGYPPGLEAIVMKALAVDPNQRYQSAGALLEAIEAFAVSARMSLSTMALGRFMRDMFGEMSEPWLNNFPGRDKPIVPRESTISNTNGTGNELVPALAAPPPVAEVAAPPAAAALEPARTILDLPRGEGERREESHSNEWNAKSYPTLPPAYEPPPTAPDPVALRHSQPNLTAIAPPTRDSGPIIPPGPITPSGAFAAIPASGPIRASTQPPFQTPGSGTGPAIPVATAHGYASAPGAVRSDLSYPRYEPPREPTNSELQLAPNRRPLFIGLGVALLGVVIILAIALGGSKKDDDTKAAGGEPPIAILTAEAGIAETGDTTPDGAVAGVKQPVLPSLDASVEAPAEEMIAIHVQSVPPGGDVILDGEFLGVAPIDVKRKRSNKHVTLMVRHAHYDDAKSTIDLSGDASRTVTLTKKPEPTPPPGDHVKLPDPNAHKNNPPPPPPDPKKKCQLPGQYNPYDARPVCK